MSGATGAGKTSLLDTLADRTTAGRVDGDVFVNNRKRGPGFRGKVAYVQQTDIHLATATVREALQFSALLRQPATKLKADKLAYVETVLDMMDMRGYAEAVIGVPGEGLNIEQRRRLTIAVELVAQAELLLFLDEPTSGLDSQTAWSICMLLRKLADHGQTILCTIHQPSFRIFSMFDRLLLLDNGSPLYFGALGYEASTLINYFESNGARGFVSGENPAEWMLEIASGPPDKESQGGRGHNDWSEIWQSTPQKREALRELAELRSGVSGTMTSSECKDEGRKFAAPFGQQVIVALANGISFYNATLDYTGVVGLLFSIFLITSLFSTIDQLVIAYLDTRRGLFEARERNSKMYSWVVFVASNLIVELLWQTVISVPVFAAWYYPTGLQHNGDATFGTMERGALSWVLIWLFTLWASTLSQAFAVGIEHGEVAMQMATLFYWLTLVFCGILVSPDTLRRFWIFMYRVSPLTYLLEGLAVAGLAHTEVTCSVKNSLRIPLPPDSAGASCGDYLAAFAESAGGVVLNPSSYSDCRYCTVSSVDMILASFGMSPQHTWRNVGILAVYVVFNILMTFGIYWLARVPKARSKRS
ncbi:hypothetical protein KJ359_004395 [Pestalotiopsis sp. 9143b]|nr:hypothetical protein KJ359_004395 [Pestalotiopsis sp. 9143b]